MDEEDEEPTQVGTSKEAYISGHKFTIPSKYLYEVDNEEILYVYDESTEWIAEMTLTQYLYSTISSNIDTIVNNFTSSGFTVEGYEEKTAIGFVRNGKNWTTKNRIWKVYSQIWPRLLPFRRILLAIYRLLWLGQLPQRITNRLRSKRV